MHNKKGEMQWKNTLLQNLTSLREAFMTSYKQMIEKFPLVDANEIYEKTLNQETSTRKAKVKGGESTSPAIQLMKRAGLPIGENFPDSKFRAFKAAALKSSKTWSGVQALCKAYENAEIPHPRGPEALDLIKNNKSSNRSISSQVKVLMKATPIIPKSFMKKWCEDEDLPPSVTGLYMHPGMDNKDVDIDFLLELTALSHEYWGPDEVRAQFGMVIKR